MSTRPTYTCYRAANPPRIDGALDDPAWRAAPWVDLCLAGDGGQPSQPTRASLVWDDTYLYVAFDCQDTDIWGITTEPKQPIYDQEVVEVFLDADCDGRGYVEIEVSPLNAVLDLFMLWRDDVRRGLWDWTCEGLLTAVRVDGDATRRGTPDRRWTAELAVPLAEFFTAPNVPPQPGDVWHMNLYRIDRAPAGDEYSAWSPPMRLNYHTPERFGRLVFSSIEVTQRP
jgi:hypothetical protein